MPLVLERRAGERLYVGPSCVLAVDHVERPAVLLRVWEPGSARRLALRFGDRITLAGVGVKLRDTGRNANRVDLVFAEACVGLQIWRGELLSDDYRAAVEAAAGCESPA